MVGAHLGLKGVESQPPFRRRTPAKPPEPSTRQTPSRRYRCARPRPKRAAPTARTVTGPPPLLRPRRRTSPLQGATRRPPRRAPPKRRARRAVKGGIINRRPRGPPPAPADAPNGGRPHRAARISPRLSPHGRSPLPPALAANKNGARAYPPREGRNRLPDRFSGGWAPPAPVVHRKPAAPNPPSSIQRHRPGVARGLYETRSRKSPADPSAASGAPAGAVPATPATPDEGLENWNPTHWTMPRPPRPALSTPTSLRADGVLYYGDYGIRTRFLRPRVRVTPGSALSMNPTGAASPQNQP